MEIEHTNRGFAFARGVDRYGLTYTIQDSSLADEDCTWLGIQTHRMHLTQAMVAELLPLLKRFVETGSIEANG